MEEQKNRKVYMPIGSARLLDISVYLDDNLVYEGMIEDAPKEIKDLKYSKVEMKGKFVYYAYSDMQNKL